MIRCSSIAQIMTKPRGKGVEWSATAEEAMLATVRERLFNVRKSLDDVRCIEKGKLCEDLGVELYNDVFFDSLVKMPPESRRNNGIITGEPDLIATHDKKGVDIKCSWSLLTFPLTEKQADKKQYEWQARGYMCLFDLDVWEVAYCMIDTPEELLKPWDNLNEHIVDSAIPLSHRITIVRYERDKELEEQMLAKCSAANAWIDNAVKQFSIDHKG